VHDTSASRGRDEYRLQLLRAGHASDVPLWHRRGWIRATLQLLEEATRLSAHHLFVGRWLAGVVYAQLPSLFNQRDAACTDLSWGVEHALRSRPCAAAFRLAAGRTGGLGRHAGWHASAQGAAGPAAGNAGAGAAGGAV
jgi:hypothetical protein